MTHVLTLRGYYGETNEALAVIDTVRQVSIRNGITYPLVTVEINQNPIVIIGWQTGFFFSEEGTTKSIELPTLNEFVNPPSTESGWGTLITEISEALPNTLISLLVGETMEMALNGKIIT